MSDLNNAADSMVYTRFGRKLSHNMATIIDFSAAFVFYGFSAAFIAAVGLVSYALLSASSLAVTATMALEAISPVLSAAPFYGLVALGASTGIAFLSAAVAAYFPSDRDLAEARTIALERREAEVHAAETEAKFASREALAPRHRALDTFMSEHSLEHRERQHELKISADRENLRVQAEKQRQAVIANTKELKLAEKRDDAYARLAAERLDKSTKIDEQRIALDAKRQARELQLAERQQENDARVSELRQSIDSVLVYPKAVISSTTGRSVGATLALGATAYALSFAPQVVEAISQRYRQA